MKCNRERVKDAELFLFFIKKTRERMDIKIQGKVSDDLPFELKNKKFCCIYCGCGFVYKKSLVGHMDRLHNIKFKLNK